MAKVGDIIKTPDLIRYTNETRSITSSPDGQKKIQEWRNKIRELEERYVLSSQVCSLNKLNYDLDHLPDVNYLELKDLISNKFYDPVVMKDILCLSNSLFFMQPNQIGAVSPNQRIHNWLQDLKQIGAESVEGYAIKASFDKAKDIFVLKAPRSERTDLLHELVVGLKLNQVRSYVPNFAYVFGGFQCTPPGIYNKEVFSWCNTQRFEIKYIMYENIQPSISLSEYIKGCTFEQWLGAYLQILYALMVADELVDFTHYDLHTENVLLRKLDRIVDIPYTIEDNSTVYINTNVIATIIDYGFSHVKLDSMGVGIVNLLDYAVFPGRSFPIYDAYKLLMMSIKDMARYQRSDLINKAERIFRFFNNSEPLQQVLDQQWNGRYFTPYNNKTKRFKLRDLGELIRTRIPEYRSIVSANPRQSRVLGCTGTDVCLTEGETVSILGLNKQLKVNTVFEFYDLVSRLLAEGRDQDANQVIQMFDYTNAINQGYINYEKIKNTLVIEFINNPNINIITVANQDKYLLFDRQSGIYDQYKFMVVALLGIHDIFFQLKTLYDAIKYVSDTYQLDTTSLNNSYLEISTVYQEFKGLLEYPYHDYQYLNSVLNDKEKQELNLPELSVISAIYNENLF